MFRKFIPFAKVDAAKREVWGIATAEIPDKDGETCDYGKSKPFYQQWNEEFSKATDGKSLGNVRYMHQLDAVGKVIACEFRDAEKEIFIGARIVDDDAWKKVEEGVLTGFSQGGDYVDGPDENGRYTAKPSEVSVVDNPCLGAAHFAYIKADGTMELRKARSERTKRIAGEDLPPSAFAYVGDPEKTDTWKLPIKFSDEEKTKSHIRDALARFDQTEGIPDGERARVKAKIEAAAREHGIDVSEKSESDAIGKLVAQIDELTALVRAGAGGTMDKNEVEKARKSLHDNLAALKEAHEAHKAATEKHHAKMDDAIEKCMKAVGSYEHDEPAEEDGDEKSKKFAQAVEAEVKKQIEVALEKRVEPTSAKSTLVPRDNETQLDPELADLVGR